VWVHIVQLLAITTVYTKIYNEVGINKKY